MVRFRNEYDKAMFVKCDEHSGEREARFTNILEGGIN